MASGVDVGHDDGRDCDGDGNDDGESTAASRRPRPPREEEGRGHRPAHDDATRGSRRRGGGRDRNGDRNYPRD